jgi:TonB family protein
MRCLSTARCSQLIGKLIFCVAVAPLAAGAWAQSHQRPPGTVDEAGPTYIHGELVYRVGGDVIAPHAVYTPDPEYSEEARRAEVQGTCLLWMVVGTDGKPHDVRIARSLDPGLDKKSVEAVRTWRFEPARKDTQAVAVQINVETSFRLYSLPGLPAALDPFSQDTEGSRVPDKHAADYPLVVDIVFVKGMLTAEGYVVTAEASIAAGAQSRQVVAMTCGPKGRCFMLKPGNYPARWLRADKMELIGRIEDRGKLQKARYSATPIL